MEEERGENRRQRDYDKKQLNFVPLSYLHHRTIATLLASGGEIIIGVRVKHKSKGLEQDNVPTLEPVDRERSSLPNRIRHTPRIAGSGTFGWAPSPGIGEKGVGVVRNNVPIIASFNMTLALYTHNFDVR